MCIFCILTLIFSQTSAKADQLKNRNKQADAILQKITHKRAAETVVSKESQPKRQKLDSTASQSSGTEKRGEDGDPYAGGTSDLEISKTTNGTSPEESCEDSLKVVSTFYFLIRRYFLCVAYLWVLPVGLL